MYTTAKSSLRAKKAGQDALPTRGGEETQDDTNILTRLTDTLKAARNASAKRLWHERTVLEKTILLLLASFTLSIISFVFYAILFPLAHYRQYNEAGNFFLVCFLAFVYTWAGLLRFHSYRSNDTLPGRLVRVLTSGFASLLGTYSAFGGASFIVVSLRVLFCSRNSPDQPACLGRYVGWAGILTGLLGVFLASTLAGVAIVSWRASARIQLTGEEIPEENSSTVNDSV
ncbi:hypothetical protein NMY22_g18341 [Coprinellus aureogranulatus]|nr:hypothetical protein NMY22_g18341 [Coprinellus aureogranulatus]